jgi:hypothetical protein
MNLDEGQRKQIEQWMRDGMKLSEIQTRMANELGLKMTYMDVRLLVDDLKIQVKDPEPPAPPPTATATAAPTAPPAPEPQEADVLAADPEVSSVKVTVDQLTRPGAMVSGKVTFSDGNKADWYLDQSGRLGLAPQKAGYRPPASDVQEFQAALAQELQKAGYY